MSPLVGSTSSFPKNLRRRTKTLVRDAGKCTSCVGCGRQSPRYNVCVERPIGTICRTPSGWFVLTDKETAPIMHPCNDILESARDATRSRYRPRDFSPRDQHSSGDTNSVFGSTSSFAKPPIGLAPNGSVTNYTNYMTSSPVKNESAAPSPLDVSSVSYEHEAVVLRHRMRHPSLTRPPPYSRVELHEPLLLSGGHQHSPLRSPGIKYQKSSSMSQYILKTPDTLNTSSTFPHDNLLLDVSQCSHSRPTDQVHTRKASSTLSLIPERNEDRTIGVHDQTKPVSETLYDTEHSCNSSAAVAIHTVPKRDAVVDRSHSISQESRRNSTAICSQYDTLTLLNQSCPKLESIHVDPRIPRIGMHGISNGRSPSEPATSASLDLLSDIRFIHYTPRELVRTHISTDTNFKSTRMGPSYTSPEYTAPYKRRISSTRFSEVTSDHNHLSQSKSKAYEIQYASDEAHGHSGIAPSNRIPNLSYRDTEDKIVTVVVPSVDTQSFPKRRERRTSIDKMAGDKSVSVKETRCDSRKLGTQRYASPNTRSNNDHSNSTASAYSSGFGSSSGADRECFLSLSSILIGRQLSNDESGSSVFSLESPPSRTHNFDDSKTVQYNSRACNKLDADVDNDVLHLIREYRELFPYKSENSRNVGRSTEERCEELKREFHLYRQKRQIKGVC